MTEDKKLKSKKSIKDKKWLKVVLGVLALLVALGVFQFFKMQKDSELRREAMMAQEEKLRDFYQEQGLSEEEIENKLKEDRSSKFSREGDDSVFRSVMRTVRHTTGTGGTPRNR